MDSNEVKTLGQSVELRRRVPRVNTTGWSGRYIVEDDPRSEWNECVVLDISVLGVGVELVPTSSDDADALLGHHMVVQVQAPIGESISVRLMGVVRHVAGRPSGRIRAGLEFVGLSDTEQAILKVMELMQVAW